MRIAMILSFLVVAQIAGGVSANGRTPPASAEQFLTLIPTALRQLDELRVNTGTKAVLRDGTLNAVYDVIVPSPGNTYLNFHVDVASKTGPFVLQTKDIRLERAMHMAVSPDVGVMQGKMATEAHAAASYTPMDWFLDTGAAEVRGDSLTVKSLTILQFTIEVPRPGLDDLTLFVRSQRIGTVKEIRERIARVGEQP